MCLGPTLGVLESQDHMAYSVLEQRRLEPQPVVCVMHSEE